MKKIYQYISYLFASLVIFTACSSEETIIPGNVPFVDPFIIPADKTDAESVLRRGFYERTGVHLVLRDEVGQAYDADGNPYIETIDLQWGYTSNMSPYNYTILSSDQQAKAVEILEKYIMPHLCGEGNKLYSVYPVADYVNDYGRTQTIFNNNRCTLINMKSMLGADTDDEIKTEVAKTLTAIVTDMLQSLPYDDRALFYNFSEEYHSEYIVDYIPEWVDNQDLSYIYEYGFVNYYQDWYGDVEYDSFPYYSTDFTQFINLVMENTEEEVREKFADYPLVISKYEIMCNLMTKAGYVL